MDKLNGPKEENSKHGSDIKTSVADVRSEAQLSALEAPSEQALRVRCYCEENVWRLAYRRLHTHLNDGIYHVVFVSNEIQCVPMFYQLAASSPDEPCFWDYHVILLWTTPNDNSNHSYENPATTKTKLTAERPETVVLDMDSHLPYPFPLDEYLHNVFPSEYTGEQEKFAPLFRVVEAAAFLAHFCSDRLHMYDAHEKKWRATPPAYDCIQTIDSRESKKTSNLMDYVRMERLRLQDEKKEALVTQELGRVMTLEQLRQRFCDS